MDGTQPQAAPEIMEIRANTAAAVELIHTAPDGFTFGGKRFQGVRVMDPATGHWTSPDAYAGDVHDPMSQKPFMWNRNNPYVFSDPSGYSPLGDGTRAALNFLILSDINTLRDKQASGLAKAMALASILSNFSGPGKGIAVGAKAVLKMSEKGLQHAAERHLTAYGGKASGIFNEGTTATDVKNMVEADKLHPDAKFAPSQGNVLMEYTFRDTIGTTNGKPTSTMRAIWDGQTGEFLTALPVKPRL